MARYEYLKAISCHAIFNHKGNSIHLSLHAGHIYELPLCDKTKSLLSKGMIKQVEKTSKKQKRYVPSRH